MSISSATPAFRWQHRSRGPFRWVLQQAWVDHGDGTTTWQDIPAVDEQEAAVVKDDGLRPEANGGYSALIAQRTIAERAMIERDAARAREEACQASKQGLDRRIAELSTEIDVWAGKLGRETARADANEKERDELRTRLFELEEGLGVAKAKAYAELAARRLIDEQANRYLAAQAWAKRNAEAKVLRQGLRDILAKTDPAAPVTYDAPARIRHLVELTLEAAANAQPDLAGDWDGHRCPRCGGSTLMDRLGRRWCSYVGGLGSPPCTWASWGDLKDPAPAAATDSPTPPAEGALPEGPQG